MASTTPARASRRATATGLLAVAALVLALLPAARATAVTETDDTVGVVKEQVAPSNAEIAVRLSEVTPLADTDVVVVARDDAFADALASGVLQKDAPMLLVPSSGPVPARVLAEIARLESDRAIILGGDAAIDADVEAQLQSAGLQTERRAGDTRLTTAVDIAATDAADATTVIMARAFAAADAADETQAFADSLAVGAWAAEEGWPVVLTETEQLSPPTRAYLLASDVEEVQLIGGVAAISQAVEDELVELGYRVNRIAGTDRFGTAVEVAKERGAESAADVAQVVVADSQFANAWAGGLAAAAHSAHFGAPVLLTSGPILPDATAAFLAGGTDGSSGTPMTCVAFPVACEQARVGLGLPPAAVVSSDTQDGAVVTPGQQVTVTVDGGGRAVSDVEASGSCLPGPVAGSGATVTVTLDSPLPPVVCELRVDFTVTGTFAQGDPVLRQAEVLTFTTAPPGGQAVTAIPSGPDLDARRIASNLVGDDVQVFDAVLRANPEAAGLFVGGPEILGFDQGIVLSTGFVEEVADPSAGGSGQMGTPGDPDLTALAGRETRDAAILEFDFVAAPDATSVRFEYVFGSVEYPDFVGTEFNDVFAFFINGVNCATVGGQPVSVNTVNADVNADAFRDNQDRSLPINVGGLTVTLPCEAAINPGGANRVKLAIADATDDILDSAVFIRAASFRTS